MSPPGAARSRLLPRIIAGFLALSVLALAGSLIAGLLLDDVRGNVAFGLLVASIAVAISSALSMAAPGTVFAIARRAWISASFVVLAVGLVLGGEAGDSVLTYAMAALGAPASFIAAPLAGTVLGGATRQPLGLAILWLALFLVGYVQWYVVLARMFRKEAPR